MQQPSLVCISLAAAHSKPADHPARPRTPDLPLLQVDPSAIFVTSSPTKGVVLDSPDGLVLRWGWIGDTRYGTVHHYDYMSDCENFRSYPNAKFVTEFGEWVSCLS